MRHTLPLSGVLRKGVPHVNTSSAYLLLSAALAYPVGVPFAARVAVPEGGCALGVSLGVAVALGGGGVAVGVSV